MNVLNRLLYEFEVIFCIQLDLEYFIFLKRLLAVTKPDVEKNLTVTIKFNEFLEYLFTMIDYGADP